MQYCIKAKSATFGLRAAGRFAAPVDLLEALSEKRGKGDGRLSDRALRELGVTAEEANALLAGLRTVRVQQPDRPGKAPKPVKDSPFAALAALTTPSPAAAPARRKRPRRRTGETG